MSGLHPRPVPEPAPPQARMAARPIPPAPGGEGGRSSRLEALLAFEERLRRAPSPSALRYELAQGLQRLVSTRMAIVALRRGRSWSVETVSGLTQVDKDAVLVRRIAAGVSQAMAGAGPDGCVAFNMAPGAADQGVPSSGHLAPLAPPDAEPFAALLVLCDEPLTKGEQKVLRRAADAASHAWLALQPGQARTWSRIRVRTLGLCLTLAASVALFAPVPLTILAPAEIVPRDPFVVAAPMKGVVETMVVSPNSEVSAGDVLFRYVDTDLAARRQVAMGRRDIAAAKVHTARQNAFVNAQGSRRLSIAQAELELAEAELAHAVAQAQRSVVRAAASGIALFARRDEWQGRPVALGERVLEIADPGRIALRADVASGDAIDLPVGGHVRMYTDAAPLRPLHARVERTAYRAQATVGGEIAFPVWATLDDGDLTPRIGTRGTAQLVSGTVTLGYYLFRRPLSALRQWSGL